MKNKIIASLLAVCMFVGLAVPAFAAFPTSTVGGSDEEITSLMFKKDSYTIENGSASKNLTDEVIAYCGTKKIVQNPVLEWTITDSIAFGIDSAGNVTNIGEDKGTATVTVTANEGKVKANVKVVAAKAKAETKIATGFRFTATKFSLVNTIKDAQKIKIAPTPSGTKFTAEQKTAIDTEVNKLVYAGTTDYLAPGASAVNSDNELEYVIPTAALTALLDKEQSHQIELALPKANDPAVKYTSIKRAMKIVSVKEVPAVKVVKTGSINIKVGETADLNKKIGFGPSTANVDKKVTWEVTLYDQNADTEDYAVLDDHTVLGVAVGKVKAIATLDSDATQKAEVIINVLPYTADASKATLIDKATVKVGENVKLEVKNLPEKATVAWKLENTNVNLDKFNVPAVAVYGKKEGTCKVTAIITDTNGVKTEKVCDVTITAAAKPETKPETKPGTTNPQTGDSLFANLF